jgi:RNA polymerase sigma-70 factor, ECF subfamily
VDCTGDPGHTETLVDLHKYLVLDFEAQALLFREARMSNTSTGETVIEAQFEAVYDLLRFAPTSIIQPLRMPVMRLDEARARLLAHAWERDQEKTASALVSVVPAADLDLHEKLPVVFPHVPNVRNPFADPVARADRHSSSRPCRSATSSLAARAAGLASRTVDASPCSWSTSADRVPTYGCPACRASHSTRSPPASDRHPSTAGDSMIRNDAESAEWVRGLSSEGAERERAATRLHEIALRVARAEVHRRSAQLRISGPEADDVAHQAAADAVLAIINKVGQFRGESRFTTWAYKFVIFEVSAKIGRHFWRTAPVSLETEDWARLPDRFGFEPAQQAQWRDLLAALRRAVEQELTERQRRIFVAIVLDAIPLDTLVIELNSNRNAIYKTLFDARRKLRASLAANGYLDPDTPRWP